MPTKEWVIQTVEELKEFYRQRNQNITDWRKLYFLNEDAYFTRPDGSFAPQEDDEVRVVLPTAFSTVKSILATLLTRPPVISVPESSLMDTHQDQVDDIEKMLYAIWTRSNVTRALRDALWHAVVDGWGVLQELYDPEAEARGDVPIFARSLDPLGIYPMPAERPGEWAYVFAVYSQLVGTLRHSFVADRDGRLKSTKSAKDALEGFGEDDRVTVVEYWDHEVRALLLVPRDEDSEEPNHAGAKWLLNPTEHKYGRLPFQFFHGIEMPFKDRGERMGLSSLWPIEDLIKYNCKLTSQEATIIARFTNPTLVSKTQDGRTFGMPKILGDEVGLFPDEDIYYLLPPGVAPQIERQRATIEDNIEQAGLPRHMMGQLNISRVSGVAMNLLRTPVLMAIAFQQQGIEYSLEQMNEVFLRLVENRVSEPIPLWGTAADGSQIEVLLDPDQVGGYYRNRVKLSASLPTDEPATVAMLATLRQMEVLSSRTTRDIVQQALRDIAPQSLENEEDLIQLERFLADPQIQQALARDVAAEAGILDRINELQQPQQQQGTAPGFPGMGSESGISPFNPINQLEGPQTNPQASDVVRGLANRVLGAQGGRPPTGDTSVTPEF